MNRLVVGIQRAGILGFLLAAACQTPASPAAASSVTFSVQTDSVLTGKTYQAAVTVKDVTGKEISGSKITWESLTPAVATISSAGVVTPVSPGLATIKASVSGVSATAFIKVLEKATSLVVVPQTDNVFLGATRQLTVSVSSATGASIGGRGIRWSSSNATVASVNSQGQVLGLAKGTATITALAELDNVSGTATVTVIDVPVAAVTVSPAAPQLLRIGGTLQFTATPRDNTGSSLAGRPVTWQSTSSAIASVSSSGLVTAISVGTVTITAESEGKTGNVQVQVTEVPPKSVTLSPDTVSLQTGNVRQLAPTVIDSLNRTASLANRLVSWTSSNPAVATVSPTGLVSTVTAGTARVSVTVDNVRSNDVVFIVTDQVASIRLTPTTTPPMRVGNTLQVTATALNGQNQPLSGKTFTWTTNNPSVATVSSSGLVTAVGAGAVLITAETDGRTASLSITVTLVPIGTVTLVPSSDTLVQGDVKQYNPVVTDSAGHAVTTLSGRNVQWNSTNIPVAGVSTQGIVTAAISQTGTALISVTIDGVASNNMSVRVSAVDHLDVTPSSVTVAVNGTQALAVVPKDALGNTLTTSRTISFASSDVNVATVSPAGVVRGVAAGTATIQVSIAGIAVTKLVNVTVTP